MKWRVMLEQNGELTDAARRAAARRWSATPRASAAATGTCPSTSAIGTARDGCGACDYCLDELEPAAEPVVLARKILSCVARVGQRFGAAHVASVLRGHATRAGRSRGHDKLSTFGLLPEASVAESPRLHRAAGPASVCCGRPTTSIRCWR